ncbi:MAG: DUF2804 domain-containing protein [Labilithrix sp.]|nr:DUF2804 domain-containing protein [Labilithrix sp.]
MRILSPAPPAFVDPATRAPAFGSYAGPLPPIDLGRALVDRALRRKKWFYVALASDEVWVSLAVVRMGYATSAFAFVFDLASRRMLVDRSVVGPPRAAEVADDPHGPGPVARFGSGRTSIAVERRPATGGARAGAAGPDALELRARFADLDVDVAIDEATAPPAISAIAEIGPSLASATEKRALAAVRGSLVASGRRVSLDGALGGYDYTHGLMPRHTRWRWAFAMGRAADGAAVAFNVVEGFVGEAECAAFAPGGVFPIREPRFDFDAARPDAPWRLVGEGIDLTFDVGAVHAQRTNLVLVRSRFLQPAGTFRGTLRIDGRDVALEGVPGVVEDQDVLW